MQGYFGGLFDLLLQRFIEIWGGHAGSLSAHYHVEPRAAEFLVAAEVDAAVFLDVAGGCRAGEFLRARNFDYVRAAKAFGARDSPIMFKHVLPNAMVATLTLCLSC